MEGIVTPVILRSFVVAPARTSEITAPDVVKGSHDFCSELYCGEKGDATTLLSRFVPSRRTREVLYFACLHIKSRLWYFIKCVSLHEAVLFETAGEAGKQIHCSHGIMQLPIS